MPQPQNKKQEHLENLKRATKVVRNSLLVSVGLTLIQAFGGYVTNIIPLIGSAVSSFADIISSSAIFVGLRLSQKEASKKFKYGYHRIETFISLCISIVIIIAGYKILMASVNRFYVTAATSSHDVGMAAVLVSIVASLFTFFSQLKIADRINSNALRASAYDKRNDAIVSLGVLGSIVADKFKIPYVEGAMGIAIALLVLYTGFKYAKEALYYLLDYWNEPGVEAQIRSILGKSKIVTAVKNIRLRHAGTYIFGEAFLQINPFTDSKDLRDEIHRLDRKVEENVEHLGDLVLYVDPPKPTVVHVAIPIVHEDGLASQIAEDAAAPFQFLFVEIKDGKIKNYYSRRETFTTSQVSEIANFLKQQKTNILISSLIRPLLYYNLRLNNIKVYPHFLEVKDVGNTVKLLLLDI